FSEALYSAVDRRAWISSEALFSAPDARAYFLFCGKKKVAKEKATPGYAVGCADSPALLEGPGGCGTRGCAPQTVLADYPRPFCAARRSTWGPQKASQLHRSHGTVAVCGQLWNSRKIAIGVRAP